MKMLILNFSAHRRRLAHWWHWQWIGHPSTGDNWRRNTFYLGPFWSIDFSWIVWDGENEI